MAIAVLETSGDALSAGAAAAVGAREGDDGKAGGAVMETNERHAPKDRCPRYAIGGPGSEQEDPQCRQERGHAGLCIFTDRCQHLHWVSLASVPGPPCEVVVAWCAECGALYTYAEPRDENDNRRVWRRPGVDVTIGEHNEPQRLDENGYVLGVGGR